jgi:hypothetical protein
MREHVVEVDSLALHVALGHQARFVLHHDTCGVLLCFENPLEPNGAVPRRKIGECPRVVFLN